MQKETGLIDFTIIRELAASSVLLCEADSQTVLSLIIHDCHGYGSLHLAVAHRLVPSEVVIVPESNEFKCQIILQVLSCCRHTYGVK